MRLSAALGTLIVVLSAPGLSAELPRCGGAISACFKIEGSLSMIPNMGFVLDVEGTRSFTMSRHTPLDSVSKIIGLDLSAKIGGIYTICPMRHDTTRQGHRHVYCIEEIENLIVTPSGSAKSVLCSEYTCKP